MAVDGLLVGDKCGDVWSFGLKSREPTHLFSHGSAITQIGIHETGNFILSLDDTGCLKWTKFPEFYQLERVEFVESGSEFILEKEWVRITGTKGEYLIQ